MIIYTIIYIYYICIYVQNNENNAKFVLCFSLIICFQVPRGLRKNARQPNVNKKALLHELIEGFAAEN